MTYLPFVNREHEIDTLSADIHANRSKSRAVIIVANPGIGKSRLTQHVLDLIDSRPTIKLSLKSIRRGFSPDGQYVRMLAIACDERAASDRRIPSFESFITSRPLTKQLGDPVREIGSILVESNSTLKALRDIAKYAGKQSTKAKDLFIEPTAESCISACDYLTFVMSRAKPIINIENVQDIDDSSFELLIKSIGVSPGQYLLLEFTSEDDGGQKLEDIQGVLREADIEVALYPLERLKVEHVLEILKGQPTAVESLVRNLYMKSSGSLRPLTDLFVQAGSDPSGKAILLATKGVARLADFTNIAVRSLFPSEKLVLATVTLHGGWVDGDLLARMAIAPQFSSAFLDVEAAVSVLLKKQFLETDTRRRLRATEAAISAIENDDSFVRERLLAIQFWKSIYQELSRSNDDTFVPRAEALYYLIYFYFLEGDLFECSKVLGEALYLASRSYAPSRFILFIQRVRAQLQRVGPNDFTIELDQKIAGALQTLGFYDEALEVAQGLPESITKLHYVGVLLENAGKAAQALDVCESALGMQAVKEDVAWLVRFQMAKFAALRSLNRGDECLALFRLMRSTVGDKQLYELGYVLRAAGSCLESGESLPFLKQSVGQFRMHNAPIQEAFSRIELAVAFADIYSLDEAEAELFAAETLLDGQISERHTIYNDRACILLQRGLPSSAVAAFLRQSLMTARASFDRIAIQVNLLINSACVAADATPDIAKNILALCSEGGFSSRELLCLVHYNIALYARIIGDRNEFSRNMSKVRQLCEELKIDGEYPEIAFAEIPADTQHLIGGLPFKPVYLASWHMELVR